MKQICEGCLTYDMAAPDNCIILANNDQRKCPCIKCLVKMVCENPCKEVRNLWYRR